MQFNLVGAVAIAATAFLLTFCRRPTSKSLTIAQSST
jgi:hypothetical protein